MPFLTDVENKQYEKSPFINKFSVESFYDYESEVDFETISRAREMDKKYDGDNFSGRNDSYNFNLYDTLEDALNHHHKRIDLVNFENLTDYELKIAKDFVKEKLNDEEYLKKYGLSKEQVNQCTERFEISFSLCSKGFEISFMESKKNLLDKTIENHSISIVSLKSHTFDIKEYIKDVAKANKVPSCDVFVQVTYEQDGEYVDSDEMYFKYDDETKNVESEMDLENDRDM